MSGKNSGYVSEEVLPCQAQRYLAPPGPAATGAGAARAPSGAEVKNSLSGIGPWRDRTIRVYQVAGLMPLEFTRLEDAPQIIQDTNARR